jgi:SAM-dependent methyltransferase
MKHVSIMPVFHGTNMIAESTRKVLDLIDDPADAGEKTLRRVSGLFRYNTWLWEQIAAFTGQRVLEVGAGIGTMTQFFLDRQLILVTDVDARYLARLPHTFANSPNVIVRPLDLNERFADQLAAYRLDTVLCLNVLEHIEDDEAVLSDFSHLFPSGGRVVLIVPALQRLYGEIDRAIGHYRRYEKGEIMAKFERAGFRVEETRFLNLLGLPGWYLNSCLLKRKIVPGLQARLNDCLVPLLRFERYFTLPWGMSLLAVGRKV